MTDKQIRWAASHDWYTCHRKNGRGEGEVWVQDFVNNDPAQEVWIPFTNYQELKEWAGY